MSNSKEELGPGIWFCIHIKSLSSSDIDDVIEFIWLVRDYLSCRSCKEHIRDYLMNEENKAIVVSDKQKNLGINLPFLYTVNFHNSVNRRLEKDEIKPEKAIKLYVKGEEKSCSSSCDSSEDPDDYLTSSSNSCSGNSNFSEGSSE